MKIKRLFTLAALLTSPLAGAVDMSDLQDQYYAGLNFGGGYSGGGMSLRPNIVIGYHLDKMSKLELEFGGRVSFSPKTSIALSPMLNYRFYPDLDLDPVSLYVSGGLGGMFHIGGGATDTLLRSPSRVEKSSAGVEKDDDEELGNGNGKSTPTNDSLDKVAKVEGGGNKNVSAKGPSVIDNILGKVAYKVKVGVDYAFTPQIIGAVGLMAGGTLFNIKEFEIPDAVLEIGIRYNF